MHYVAEKIKYELEVEPEIINIIIFDDMGAFLRNNDTQWFLKKLVMNRRHYQTSIYFLYEKVLKKHRIWWIK